jgi:hypothetical protein
MQSLASHTSVFSMRMKLHQMVSEGIVSADVLNQLILDGELVTYERELWDFKSELPLPSTKIKPSEEEKIAYELKIGEVIKDVVSFYNSYGGYLVVGVSDNPKIFVGWNGSFNCDELNKKIKKYIKHDIETHYVNVPYLHNNKVYEIGILYIPQRLDSKEVAQFKIDAIATSSGKQAFKKNDIYFRSNDECRAAKSPEDYAFLCAGGRRKFNATESGVSTKPLLSNLGPRDPGFIEFIGRENYLEKLWIWLLDKYAPIKLLAGLGGVGKTAIAREFAETLAHTPPAGFEKIIWLSAKKQFYTAILGKFTPVTRIDFDDVPSLLKALLRELGALSDDLAEENDRQLLIETVIESLQILPVFLIIDDIDSLETNEQQDVFHTIIQILSQTTNSPTRASRAILTARLDLGAAPGQVFRIEGLEQKDFEEFAVLTATSLELPTTVFQGNSKLLVRFRETSSGSPTFCSSILRLVSMGENFEQALSKWKGADGDDVRNFAFKKEVDSLSDIDARAFYVIIILGESSLVELTIILGTNETAVRDTISTLRKYHLVSMGNSELPGGTSIVVPADIRLMQGVVKERVSNFAQIERACANARSKTPRVDDAELGKLINRVVAFWNANNSIDAKELALYLVSKYKNNPELLCLLGRANLQTDPPNFVEADKNFRLAKKGGCTRPELEGFWIDSKIAQNDWQGVLQVTEYYSKDVKPSDRLFFRGTAYQQLAENSLLHGNFASAASNLQLGADELSAGFAKNHAKGKVEELRVLKSDLFTQLIKVAEKTSVDPEQYIDVWLVVVKSYDARVRGPHLLRLGIAKLMGWWDAVERRDRYDSSTEDLARKQVSKILEILRHENDPGQRAYIEAAVADLDKRVTDYANAAAKNFI